MRFFNKSSGLGCLVGFVLSPVLIAGVTYLVLQKELDPTAMSFGPPHLPWQHEVPLEWTVRRLDGTEVSVRDEAKNQVVLVNFWATWCAPCLAEMPGIQSLYETFEGRMAFLCVSDEDLETIREFQTAGGYSVPMYRYDGVPPREFALQGVPTAFLVSEDGTVILKHIGGADWVHESVVDFLEQLLSGEPEQAAEAAAT